MSDSNKKPWEVIVTGDISLDKNIYKGERDNPEDKEYGTDIHNQKGGACIIYDILLKLKLLNISKKANLNKKWWELNTIKFGLNENIFEYENIHRSLVTYATWERKEIVVPKEFKNKYLAKDIKPWKVSLPLGFGSGTESIDQEELKELYEKFSVNFEPVDTNNMCFIFDNGGHNYQNAENVWRQYLANLKEVAEKEEGKEENKDRSIVILKTGYPLTHGKLFRELTTKHKEKLIIITSIDEIRREDVLVSKRISWEQTALDLVRELTNKKSRIHGLLQCRYLIINFQCEGALYIKMKSDDIWECRLIFDAVNLEGEWSKLKKQKKAVIGLNDIFASGIAYGFLINDKAEEAIKRSLSAMKLYVLIGHGAEKNIAGFPVKQICQEMMDPTVTYASAFVPIPDKENIFCNCDNRSQWTILEGNYYYWKKKKAHTSNPLFDTGCRYALLGKDELANAPVLEIKDYVTYDRWEIEALRNIMNLIDEYLENGSSKKPLSIGVFGGPGSGKSFAVKNIAKSINEKCFMEFNLSQFVDVHELEGAFHQVRDKILSGITPVVFWDEFDSQEYRWLQYLLAPMQDGKFQEGQLTHPIGKCIFIFAGATSYSYETFGVRNPDEKVVNSNRSVFTSSPATYPSSHYHSINRSNSDKKYFINYEINVKRRKDFILKKGPDFISRLCGYLNVKGPNKLVQLDEYGNPKRNVLGDLVYDETDIFYPIRRALYIRNTFKKKLDKNHMLLMDYGVVNALIQTREYKHGARSLMQILSYMKSSKTKKIQRSSLPTRSVMEMVVDYDDFIDKMKEDCCFVFKAYSIAAEIHGMWDKIYGIKSDYHKEYNHLPSHSKTDNIEAAKRIPKLVKEAECGITEEPNEENEESFNDNLMKQFHFKGDIADFKNYLYGKLMFVIFNFKFPKYVTKGIELTQSDYKKARDKGKDEIKYLYANYLIENRNIILNKKKNREKIDDCLRFKILKAIDKILDSKIDPKILKEIIKTFGIIYKLAKIEHDEWKKVKKNNGWQKADCKNNRNDGRKLHHDMVPFEELLIKEIFKDVDSICNIQENLEKVGLYIKEKS